MVEIFNLRDYQEESIQSIHTFLENPGGKGAIVLPPASGKTVIFTKLLSQLKAKAIMIVVHREELISQTVAKLKAYGLKYGIEKAELTTNAEMILSIQDQILENRLTHEEKLKKTKNKKDVLNTDLAYLQELLKNKEQELDIENVYKKINELNTAISSNLEKLTIYTNELKNNLKIEEYTNLISINQEKLNEHIEKYTELIAIHQEKLDKLIHEPTHLIWIKDIELDKLKDKLNKDIEEFGSHFLRDFNILEYNLDTKKKDLKKFLRKKDNVEILKLNEEIANLQKVRDLKKIDIDLQKDILKENKILNRKMVAQLREEIESLKKILNNEEITELQKEISRLKKLLNNDEISKLRERIRELRASLKSEKDYRTGKVAEIRHETAILRHSLELENKKTIEIRKLKKPIKRAMTEISAFDLIEERTTEKILSLDRSVEDTVQQVNEANECTIVVASIQSLHKRRLFFWSKKIFDLIIFDEGHHLRAKTWKYVEEYFTTANKLIFTATPSSEVNYPVLYSKDIFYMVSRGYLSKADHIKILKYGMAEQDTAYKDLLKDLIREHTDEKIIIFCASVDQAHDIEKEMGRSDVRAVSSRLASRDRTQVVEWFKGCQRGVLLNYMIVNEGFDVPDATMVIAKQTESIETYIQTVGRILRLSVNGRNKKIVDIILDKKQCTLPVLYGLHRNWEFIDTPFEDAVKARDFAQKFNKNLSEHTSWQSLIGLPEVAAPIKKPRKGNFSKVVDGMFDKDMSIVKKTDRYATLVFRGGSNFYSEKDALSKAFKENLEHALNTQPIKQIDKSLVEVVSTSEEDRRLLALSYIRKYHKDHSFLRSLLFKSKRFKLSDKQVDYAIALGREIKATLAEVE